MADRVFQIQSGTRNQPISPKLADLLASIGDELDVYFEVTSGGQPSKKEGGKRIGSDRHDHGNAADTKAYVLENGNKRYLDFSNDADKKVWGEILRLSVAGGAKGIGADDDYMGTKTAHIGFGKPSRWGADGRAANAPEWVVAAYESGLKTPPGSIPTRVASAPVPLDMPQGIRDKRSALDAINAVAPVEKADYRGSLTAYAQQPQDTGALTVPSRRPDSASTAKPKTVQEAMQQLAAAKAGRSSGDSLAQQPAPLSATPRMPADGSAASVEQARAANANMPAMDVKSSELREKHLAGGRGSLLEEQSPALRTANIATRDRETAAISPTVPARRPDTAPSVQQAAREETRRQTATLPSGKSVEVGRIYTVNGEDFIGGVKDGVGTLTKAPSSIVEEAKSNSIAGEAVRQAVRDETGKVIRGAVEAAPKIVGDAAAGLSSLAGNVAGGVGGLIGGMFGGKGEQPAALGQRGNALTADAAYVAALKGDAFDPTPRGDGYAALTFDRSKKAPTPLNKPAALVLATGPKVEKPKTGQSLDAMMDDLDPTAPKIKFDEEYFSSRPAPAGKPAVGATEPISAPARIRMADNTELPARRPETRRQSPEVPARRPDSRMETANAGAPWPLTRPAALSGRTKGNALSATSGRTTEGTSSPTRNQNVARDSGGRQLYQSAGYVFAAREGGGYEQVGKIKDGKAVLYS